jgi:NAD-dependent SIR2 family protein deacetylase
MTVICSECEEVFDDRQLDYDDDGELIEICPYCGQEAFFNDYIDEDDDPRYDDSIDYEELKYLEREKEEEEERVRRERIWKEIQDELKGE